MSKRILWLTITTFAVLLLAMAYAAPASADGGTVTVELYNEADDTGLDGGDVYYYDGGWQFLGTTGDDGQGIVSGAVPKTTDIEIRYKSGKFKWSGVDPSSNPTLRTNTKVVTMKLLDSGDNELNGTAEFYSGGYIPFGGGTTTTSMELLPGTYGFQVHYYGRNAKTQDISTDPVVIFRTKQVTMKLLNCDAQELNGEAEFYYKGWIPFGGGTTETTMELLPGTHGFKVKYEGRYETVNQDIDADPTVIFRTTKVNFYTSGSVWYYNGGWIPFTSPKEMLSGPGWADFKFGDIHNPTVRLDISGCELSGYPAIVRLVDSKGNGLAGGYVQYRRNTWKEIGTTDSNGNVFALLPEKPWGLKITYEWVTNRVDPWDIDANPSVTFSTIDVLTTLKTCAGVGLEGGVAEYLSGYWRPIGTTNSNGEIHKEMLPANLQFRMTYTYGTDRFYQDTALDPSVDFTTTKVTLNYPGTISYQSGYWRAFTNPMEMMPGTYLFKFEGTGPTVRQYLTISGCEMGGYVALIRLLDSYGIGIAGGTAEWYRTSGPAQWVSVPGSTDANGNLFALVSLPAPKIALNYGCTRGWEQHPLLTDPNVVFQTGRAISDSGTCTHWRSTLGGSCPVWVPFVDGVEMLPTSARQFKGNDGSAWWEYYPIVAGTENHIR